MNDFENNLNETQENNEEVTSLETLTENCENDSEAENSLSENDVEIGSEPVIEEKPSSMRSVYDYLETFCYALPLMIVLFLFVFRYVSVDGESMMKTFYHQDKLIISNLFYTPKTGDIVVINPENHGDNEEPIIKRVIATEGQKVYIDYENWEVYVDGVKLDEPYIDAMREEEKERWGDDVWMNGTTVSKYQDEFTVADGKVFVMGDNRNNSKDSRSREYGEMNVNRILGRVIIRISPNFGFVD